MREHDGNEIRKTKFGEDDDGGQKALRNSRVRSVNQASRSFDGTEIVGDCEHMEMPDWKQRV